MKHQKGQGSDERGPGQSGTDCKVQSVTDELKHNHLKEKKNGTQKNGTQP